MSCPLELCTEAATADVVVGPFFAVFGCNSWFAAADQQLLFVLCRDMLRHSRQQDHDEQVRIMEASRRSAEVQRREAELVYTTSAERRMETRRAFRDRQVQDRRLAGSEGMRAQQEEEERLAQRLRQTARRKAEEANAQRKKREALVAEKAQQARLEASTATANVSGRCPLDAGWQLPAMTSDDPHRPVAGRHRSPTHFCLARARRFERQRPCCPPDASRQPRDSSVRWTKQRWRPRSKRRSTQLNVKSTLTGCSWKRLEL